MTSGPQDPLRYYPPAPQTRRTGPVVGVVVAVAVFVVLGLGAAAVAAYIVTGNDPAGSSQGGGSPDESSLRAAAQRYVDAVNSGDETAATRLTCDGTGVGTLYEAGSADAVRRGIKWEIRRSEVMPSGVGKVNITLEGNPGEGVSMLFKNRDGGWCAAD
jgi:hypothetical protein